jgi:serine/threonine protein kinase
VKGIPELHWHGKRGRKNLIVMELLGPSVKDLLPRWSRGSHLGEELILKIAVQCLRILEGIHERGWLWIDAKPQNICLARGSAPGRATIRLIDFGISERFVVEGTTRHVPMSKKHYVTGSVPYVSVNVHQGIQPSRRDDLEALAYCLLFMYLGKLPWRDVDALTTDKRRVHKYSLIGAAKEKTNPHLLFYGASECLGMFLKFSREMSFTEAPDYELWEKAFLAALRRRTGSEDVEITEADIPRAGRDIFRHWVRKGYYKQPPEGRDDSSASGSYSGYGSSGSDDSSASSGSSSSSSSSSSASSSASTNSTASS